MKKAHSLIPTLAAAFLTAVIFSGCPAPFENFECMTPMEYTDLANKTIRDDILTYVDSSYKNINGSKYLTVILHSSMMDKDVNFYQSWASSYSLYGNIPDQYDSPKEEHRYTDYYFIKYQSQIENFYRDEFQDIIDACGGNYKLLIMPNSIRHSLGYGPVDFEAYCDYINEPCQVYLLFQTEYEDVQLEHSSLCYEIQNSKNTLNHLPSFTFYYAKEIDPASVSDEALEDGTFFTAQDKVTRKNYSSY